MIGRLLRAVKNMGEADEVVAESDAVNDAVVALDDMRRQRDELFELVVRMERQRDDWKMRFMEQSRQHQNAQAMLESHILAVGSTLVKATELLNEARKKSNEAPIAALALRDLAMTGERVLKTSEEYGEAMRKLAATSPKRDKFGQIIDWSDKPAQPDLDGKAERDLIVPHGC
jgi:hypothetical protein